MRPYGETPKVYSKGCRTHRVCGKAKIHVSACVGSKKSARRWRLEDQE